MEKTTPEHEVAASCSKCSNGHDVEEFEVVTFALKGKPKRVFCLHCMLEFLIKHCGEIT